MAQENGSYYCFIRPGSFLNGRQYTTSEFNEQEALALATDFKTALYRYEYRSGERTAAALIYDPHTTEDAERK